MKRVKIDLDSLDLFERLVKRGYVIEDGAKTRQLARILKDAEIGVHNAYAQETRKVVLAVETNFKAVPWMRTRKSVIFDIEK